MTERGDLLISSPANPRLKAVLALRNRRDRDATGTTRLEGREELELALRAGVAPHTLFFCPELMSHDGSGTEVVAAVRALGGRKWQLLHKLVYAVALRGLLHFYLKKAAKNDVSEVMVYAVILALLLGWRVVRRGGIMAMLRVR